MHRTWLPTTLLGAALLLGCGQNEGGRCQIPSDCASGLHCSDLSGNGRCIPNVSVGDAPPAADTNAVPDTAPMTPADGGDVFTSLPDTAPDTAVADTEAVTPVDAESVDGGGID
jgi:hypothetical protein